MEEALDSKLLVTEAFAMDDKTSRERRPSVANGQGRSQQTESDSVPFSYQVDYDFIPGPEWEKSLTEFLNPPRPPLPSLDGIVVSEMTSDAFYALLLPHIVAAWDERCFCASPGFRKLLSFNFHDYGIGPTALLDSEILITEFIERRFIPIGESTLHQGRIAQRYKCPQCGATCELTCEEFSISFQRSTVSFAGQPLIASEGVYVLGFCGFEPFKKQGVVGDFRMASSPEDFMKQFCIS